MGAPQEDKWATQVENKTIKNGADNNQVTHNRRPRKVLLVDSQTIVLSNSAEAFQAFVHMWYMWLQCFVAHYWWIVDNSGY